MCVVTMLLMLLKLVLLMRNAPPPAVGRRVDQNCRSERNETFSALSDLIAMSLFLVHLLVIHPCRCSSFILFILL